MRTTDLRKGLLLLLALLLVFSIGPLFAGGASEGEEPVAEEEHDDDHDHDDEDHDDHDHDDDDHDHDDEDHDDHDDHDHEDGEMSIPHIDPAGLGAGQSLLVVASTSIVGDVVSQIAGSAATVEVLMSLGQNPHSYEPSPRDIARVEDAYIAFVNGLNLEEGLMETIENVDGTYVVPVSAGIAVLEGEEHDHDEDHDDHDHEEGEDHDDHDEDHDHDEDEDHDDHDEDHDHDEDEHHDDDEHDHEGEDDHHDHDHSAGDPHFWFDPNNVIIWAENIAEALSEADPANAAVYEANRDDYIAELEALDLEVRSLISSIPRSGRKLVTDHDAMGYYADEYGFEIIGEVIPSLSDQAEPSARDIAELADVMQDEGVSAIIVGGTAGRGLRNLVSAVAEEVGGDVQIVEVLTGSLAPAGSRGDTYLDFVRFNTEQIVAGLGR